jgi:hypothetical protein
MKFKKQGRIPHHVTRKLDDAGVVEVRPGKWMATGPRFGISSNNLGYFCDKEEAKAIVRESYRDALPKGKFYYVYPDENPDKSKLYMANGQFTVIDSENYEWLSQHTVGLASTGYAYVVIAGQRDYLHRVICPVPPSKKLLVVDHINGDKLDNRRVNLRVVSLQQNGYNTRISKNNKTGYKGVVRTPKGRYRAEIMADYQKIDIGTFDTAREASDAYIAHAKILHGEEFVPVDRVIREGLTCFKEKRNSTRT